MARRSGEKETERYHIRAIQRAMDVLDVFNPQRPSLSLMEVSQAIGLNASTTFRLLATLLSRGYIEQEAQTGRYRIGVGILRPASACVAQLDLRERVHPLLVELRDESRETVHLSILDSRNMEVSYLEKIEGLQPIGLMSSRVGGRAPAYCTGVGKALLAYRDPDEIRTFFGRKEMVRFTSSTITSVDALLEELSRIREQRYAVDNAEHEEDVMCVAVPVLGYSKAAIAALSVSGPVERMSGAIAHGELVDHLLEIGEYASRQMGYTLELIKGSER